MEARKEAASDRLFHAELVSAVMTSGRELAARVNEGAAPGDVVSEEALRQRVIQQEETTPKSSIGTFKTNNPANTG